MDLSTSPSVAQAELPIDWKFDVFLSFRGEDTRWGFISNLYRELEIQQGFKTFKDDRVLEMGASISPELVRAIEQSHLAIVVLSPNYASSTWCLDELEKIIEFMEKGDKRILPVFFNVDPSDVRQQRKSFAEAFAKHEEKFSDQIGKVNRWREALKKVGNLTGREAKNYKCERELIEVIVKRVWEKVREMRRGLPDPGDDLVGIEIGLEQMGLLLALEEKDVRFIGIWGMGGVGKTTLAGLVYKRISHHFGVAEFLVDGNVVDLQKKVLSSILKENISQVWNEHEGTFFMRTCLSNKKVLLVVDDVDCDLLKTLVKNKSWFGEGSRIIVTTRDKRVLIQNDIERSFELAGLSDSKAHELFCQNAFKKDQPMEGFSVLSKCFVYYAQGLPLALKVLGGFLYKRNLEEWNSALESLKRIPNPTIFEKLKLSYDALDDLQKNIFLDIAFFYKGVEKETVINELQECYKFNVLIVIVVLIEKSLLTIDVRNNVGMHGLVQEMAWEIVRQDSRDEPGLRSRLCHHKDIFHVFTSNTGTEAIKGIRLCLSRLKEADSSWNFECFSKMTRLKFLEFDNIIISSGPKFLPNSLRIFKWNWYPSKSLPASFQPNMLAELKMQRSNLVRLWDGRQDLPNLKYMDLSESKNLKETPDFTGIPNLEVLSLTECDCLVKVHPSIAVNKKLKRLYLYQCKNVKSFPSKIEMDSLEYLDLFMCSKVKIPEFGEGMKNLSFLNISGIATKELPSSIEHLVGLRHLYLYYSKSLQSVPGGVIFKLKCLAGLCIGGCSKLQKLVENRGKTECPKLPPLGQNFGGSCNLKGFMDLFSPEPLCLALPSPRALPSLQTLNLSDCNICEGVIPDDIGYCFPSLQYLLLQQNNFVSLPASIKCLSKLGLISLGSCKRLQRLPDLPSNRLLDVRADDCDSLKMLSEPSQQGTVTKLENFRLTTVNCFGLIDNEGVNYGIFSMLRRLAAQGISPKFRSFDIVSPGSKISEWFDIQSERDSLTVELPCTSEWMGIVFCVVFADPKDPDTLEFDKFVIQYFSPGLKNTENLENSRHMMTDHLWVFFMPRCNIQDTSRCHIEFLFNAHYSKWCRKSRNWLEIPCLNSVKRCGARLLYEQDLKNLLNGPTNILKQSRKYCDKEEGDAEPEPEPEAEEGPSGSSNKESFFKRVKTCILIVLWRVSSCFNPN